MFIDSITMAISNGIGLFKPLYWLFGKCMEGLLMLFSNQYFVALVVFTILTRLLMLPLNLKQQKTMAQTSRIQPKIQKIQNKYNIREITDPVERQKANQKMQEEMQDLYIREGHNPMNMGCGPMIFQMIFLMGIIGIIYYPLEYILGIPMSANSGVFETMFNEMGKTNVAYYQLEILQNFDTYKSHLVASLPDLFTEDKIEAIKVYRDALRIGGIDMTQFPHWKDGAIMIFPILSLLTSLGSSVISTLIQKKSNPAMAQQGTQMMLMMLMMPLFSFYISFQVPAAVSFYWVISNLVAVLQQLFMAKFFSPKKNQAHHMIEATIERRSREESLKKIK